MFQTQVTYKVDKIFNGKTLRPKRLRMIWLINADVLGHRWAKCSHALSCMISSKLFHGKCSNLHKSGFFSLLTSSCGRSAHIPEGQPFSFFFWCFLAVETTFRYVTATVRTEARIRDSTFHKQHKRQTYTN